MKLLRWPMQPDLIFCGGGNRRYAEIAIAAGYKYGARLPGTTYGELYFADQNWKRPDRTAYINALKKHRPYVASVLDWEQSEQLPEVLAWAEDAAEFVEVIVIIPKVMNEVGRIPYAIGGKPVRLGYSVPTSHGGTEIPVWQFGRRETHLLGGSPQKQKYLMQYLNVVSVDGNMMMKMANEKCCYFDPMRETRHGYWRSLGTGEYDAPYAAFELSCQNIKRFLI